MFEQADMPPSRPQMQVRIQICRDHLELKLVRFECGRELLFQLQRIRWSWNFANSAIEALLKCHSIDVTKQVTLKS
jgi:hypothetical protein